MPWRIRLLHGPWARARSRAPEGDSYEDQSTLSGVALDPSVSHYDNFREGENEYGKSKATVVPDDAPDGLERLEGRYVERFLEGVPLALGYGVLALDPTPRACCACGFDHVATGAPRCPKGAVRLHVRQPSTRGCTMTRNCTASAPGASCPW